MDLTIYTHTKLKLPHKGNRISKMEFAPECAEICDPNLCDGKGNFDEAETTYCGCDSCTSAAWNTDADGHSCGSRISYLTATIRISEKEACRTVGGVEYSAECRACDPDTCHQLNYGTTIATSVPQTPRPTPRPTPSSAPLPENNDEEPNVINGGETGNVDIENIPNYLDENPLFPETSLYCFPEYNNRKRYTNVWGKYTLEVKEGELSDRPLYR